MIKKITIDIIPHDEQRYRTVGDWIHDEHDQSLAILVSDTGDDREALCVGIHEAVEALLCIQRGITQDIVDEFDVLWEKEFDAGHTTVEEAGQDPAAPYHREHTIAMTVEGLMVEELGLKWDEYVEHLDKLHLSWRTGNGR